MAGWAALAVGLAAGACATVAVGAPQAVQLACVAVVALLEAAIGWRAGEGLRRDLRNEIKGRSSELRRALTELEIAQAETVRRLSMAVEFRDEDTGAHIERIGRFSTLLAEQAGLEAELCERMGHAAPLHDVGKVAIPDAILLKPGPLTAEERAIVETHTEEGYRLLRGSSSSILDLAATVALSHHERWDGGGYPRGLAGESIPIEGRIVAIVDVFDALTSERVYRDAYSVEEAVEMLVAERGRHFDPALLDIFLEVLGRSGPEARIRRGASRELIQATLETYATAIERGDAEMAEGAIATAIEEGLAPATLHSEVIAPALRWIGDLWEAGEIDVDAEHLATGITRRILATLYRYMLGGAEPHRERVLLAAPEGDQHTLGLQMVNDQLAAAGYQATLQADVSPERLAAAIASHRPQMVVLAGTLSSTAEPMEDLLAEMTEHHPEIPVIIGGEVIKSMPRRYTGVAVVQRIDEAVAAVEELLRAEASSKRADDQERSQRADDQGQPPRRRPGAQPRADDQERSQLEPDRDDRLQA